MTLTRKPLREGRRAVPCSETDVHSTTKQAGLESAVSQLLASVSYLSPQWLRFCSCNRDDGAEEENGMRVVVGLK